MLSRAPSDQCQGSRKRSLSWPVSYLKCIIRDKAYCSKTCNKLKLLSAQQHRSEGSLCWHAAAWARSLLLLALAFAMLCSFASLLAGYGLLPRTVRPDKCSEITTCDSCLAAASGCFGWCHDLMTKQSLLSHHLLRFRGSASQLKRMLAQPRFGDSCCSQETCLEAAQDQRAEQ